MFCIENNFLTIILNVNYLISYKAENKVVFSEL